ncbi:MAG: hypothetical protein JW953_01580 [Anaerolineae bacterium]|nr:hypothetical protein [Anaerolineae bacterium]
MFRIDVLDAGGNKVGDGPITNIESIKRRRLLDKIGGVDITLQAIDQKTAVVGAGRWYRIHHQVYGDLGTYRHATVSNQTQGAKLAIAADDTLIELAYKNCYFRRNFDNVAVDSVVSTLVGLAGGWTTGSVETGIGNTTVSYEGESVLEALDVLRDRWGRHFRLSAARTLDFGEFGDDSGLRLIRPENVPRELTNNADVAFINALEITEESGEVINRLIPVGAGVGTTQLTLLYATSTHPSYPVQTGVNADGSEFYYIEDAASQAIYGVIERPFEQSGIRPLTNSTADMQNAANALYWSALAALLRWKESRTYYAVGATKLDSTRLLPGDTIGVVFRGIAMYQGKPYKWVDVEENLWVLDIDETYNARGEQRVKLAVATTSQRRTSDSDLLSKLMRDTAVQKVHVQPNLTHSPNGPYTKRIDSTHTAIFKVRLKGEVLAINRAILKFSTSPLRSSVTTSQGGSSHTHTTTIGSGGAHTHTTTIGSGGTHSHSVQCTEVNYTVGLNQLFLDTNTAPDRLAWVGSASPPVTSSIESTTSEAHTHGAVVSSSDPHTHGAIVSSADTSHTHDLVYGLYEDTVYPQNISVAINGTDRTAAWGGPWAPSNAAIDIDDLNVTSYLAKNQVNTITFSCTAGQGEIECLVEQLLTIQSIMVT